MTRKEYIAMAKTYGIALLIIIPILIGVDFLIAKLVSHIVLLIINITIIITGFCIALYISEKRKQYIKRKREELEAKQKQEKKNNNKGEE